MGPLRTALPAIAIAALAAFGLGCGGDDGDDGPPPGAGSCADPPAEAHVQLDFGTCKGLQLDARKATEPPAVAQGDLELAAREASCELRLDLPDEGNTHVPQSEEVTYETNPPTSGNHDVTPIADGAYLTPMKPPSANPPNARNFVHSLEHGRVIIQYSPSLPEDKQLALKGVFDEDPAGMILVPNNQMPYDVAATAWQQLLGCPTYSDGVLDAIRDFRDQYRGNGPENIPLSF